MTDTELCERLARAEADAKHALEATSKNTDLIMKNSEKLSEVEARAKAAESRVCKLEGKVDTMLDKLSMLGLSQSENIKQSEKIRKSTLKVFVTLVTAIIVDVANQLLI